jgi:hypothetical protein
MADPIKQDKLLTRWAELKSERSGFFTLWKEISTYLLPYQGRFFLQDQIGRASCRERVFRAV